MIWVECSSGRTFFLNIFYLVQSDWLCECEVEIDCEKVVDELRDCNVELCKYTVYCSCVYSKLGLFLTFPLSVQVFLVRKTNGKDSGKIFAMKVLKKVRDIVMMCRRVIYSYVTKLVKIRIRQMRISTCRIRQIRMRMRVPLHKHLFCQQECNALIYMSVK